LAFFLVVQFSKSSFVRRSGYFVNRVISGDKI
jgi:hypothetical protein